MNRVRKRQIVLLLVAGAIIAALRFSGLGSSFTLEGLKENKDLLEQTVKAHYVPSVLAYILLYMGSTALAVPGAAVLTLAGGLLFHAFPGVIYVNLGATSGAVLAFTFSRYIFGRWLQARYGTQLRRFNREVDRNGSLYLLTARLIPVFPFFLINLLSGLTRLPLATFIWTTAVGILPASLVYTFAGSQLARVSSLNDLISSRIGAAFLLLALLALSPLLWKKLNWRARTMEKEKVP